MIHTCLKSADVITVISGVFCFSLLVCYRGKDMEHVFTQRIIPAPNPENKFASVI